MLAALLQDYEHMAAKPPSSSCRSNMTSILLTSNSTPVYVIPTIIPHTPTPAVGGLAMLTDRAAASGVTFAFKVQRSSRMQYLNERRLMLGVSASGTILWTSAGTPEALFGVSPQDIVGQGIASIVDVFEEYTSGKKGGAGTAAVLWFNTEGDKLPVQGACLAGLYWVNCCSH